MPGIWPIRPQSELWWDVRRSLLTNLDVPGEQEEERRQGHEGWLSALTGCAGRPIRAVIKGLLQKCG